MRVTNLKVGVALSGGGHRASAWAAGALLYLIDAGIIRDVASIASVSGGSITNAWIASRKGAPWSEARPDEMERMIGDLAGRIAIEGTIFSVGAAARLRAALLLVGGVTAIAVLCTFVSALCIWWTPAAALAAAISGTVALVAGLVFTTIIAGRGAIVVDAYDESVCAGQRLANQLSSDEHVFCATDVQFAEHVYMAKRFVYSYRYGVGSSKSVRLAEAVAASAGFPVAFPPLVRERAAFEFHAGADADPPSHLVLFDGGIYDNMGDNWLDGMGKRLSGTDGDAHARERADLLRSVCSLEDRPHQMIVVNASPPVGAGTVKASTPWGEARALLGMVFALHDNSSSIRRTTLVTRFLRDAAKEPPQESGTLVHISTDPWAKSLVPALARPIGTPLRMRAEQIVPMLTAAGDARWWAELVARNEQAGTTLDPLGVDVTADLMQHAYALAAVQTALYLGRPAIADPAKFARDRFKRLASGTQA